MEIVKLKWNRKGIASLRVLPEMIAELERHGDRMVAEANDTLDEGVGYKVSTHKGNGKQGPWVSVNVWTSSRHAQNSNAKHDTLVRILG